MKAEPVIHEPPCITASHRTRSDAPSHKPLCRGATLGDAPIQRQPVKVNSTPVSNCRKTSPMETSHLPNPLPDGLFADNEHIARCTWCQATPLYRDYHDSEWGFPVADDCPDR